MQLGLCFIALLFLRDSRPVRGACVVHYYLLHRSQYPRDCALPHPPPPPPSPSSSSWGGRQGGHGMPGGKDNKAREKEMEGWGVTEREEKKISVRLLDTLSLGPQPAERLLLAVPCDGTGHLWWTARRSSTSWRTEMAPLVEGNWQRVPHSLLLPRYGGLAAGFGADSYTPSWMAATPPRLRSTTASLPSHLFFYCSSTTASGSHWQVSATSCCLISSATRSPSAARALWQCIPPSSRVSAPM